MKAIQVVQDEIGFRLVWADADEPAIGLGLELHSPSGDNYLYNWSH